MKTPTRIYSVASLAAAVGALGTFARATTQRTQNMEDVFRYVNESRKQGSSAHADEAWPLIREAVINGL
jgi:hypothetical protein